MEETEGVRRPRPWDYPFHPRVRELVALRDELEGAKGPRAEQLRARVEEAEAWSRAYLDDLLQYPPWRGMVARGVKRAKLEKILLHQTRRRRLRRGEVVIRQGDYGNSAFIVLRGAVRVVLESRGTAGLTAAELGKADASRVGILGALGNWFRSKGRERRDLSAVNQQYLDKRDEDYIPIFLQDVPRILDRNRTVQLSEGELFGEIAALGRMPRTASVFADAEDVRGEDGPPEPGTELLEIRWQGLRDLRRTDAAFKQHVDSVYRKNALRSHLRRTPFLEPVGDSPALRERVVRGDTRGLFVEELGFEPRDERWEVSGTRPARLAYQLRVTDGPEAGKVFPLDPAAGEASVGRGGRVDLALDADGRVSREHAGVVYDRELDLWVLLNRSTYGTLVHGRVIRGQVPLRPGIGFTVGESRVAFELTPASVEALRAGLGPGHTYTLHEVAELPADRGALPVTVYEWRSDGPLPALEVRRAIREHVGRERALRHVITFLGAGGAEQAWHWVVPEDEDPASQQPREARFRQSAPSRVLLRQLLRVLLLEQIGRQTEFQSFGEFAWSLQKGKEPEVAAQGHYPNGVVLIRGGFARRSRRYNQGRRTLGYLGRGESFGFEEIVHNWRHRSADQPPIPLETALTALGYLDALLIPTRTIERFVLPSLSEAALSAAGQTLAALRSEPGAGVELPTVRDPAVEGLVEFVAERRFYNGTASMVIDLDRCTRCDDCVRGCASTHLGNPRFIRHGPTHGRYMFANACMHCADPVCMIGCPTGAIHRSVGGEVVVNDATCIGCTTCANNCPYDAIRMVEIRDRRGELVRDPKGQLHQRATKCDLCLGQSGGPACVRACPHDALRRVDLTSMAQLVSREGLE